MLRAPEYHSSETCIPQPDTGPDRFHYERVQTLAGLEQVFFGGMELAALSTPSSVAVLVIQQRYPVLSVE